jgi:hypothetical protein
MAIDYSDEVGFPAEPGRVYEDPTRIGPVVLTAERRAEQREAHLKWLLANPDKMQAARRAWREARRGP